VIRRGALLLVLLAGLAAGTVEARPAAYPKTRTALNDLVKAGAPGAVVLIRKGSSTTLLAAGVADRRTRRLMRPDDRFRIASITKTFVATLVLQLVGEGKLALSDTVEKLCPASSRTATRSRSGSCSTTRAASTTTRAIHACLRRT
jgi:D-alanyl-D-alanine carboxypeptidase